MTGEDHPLGPQDRAPPGERPDAVKLAMPSGSLAIAKGTLWHRGGANRSERPRLIITPQYCAGWVRQLENMALAVPIMDTTRIRAELGWEPRRGADDRAHARL